MNRKHFLHFTIVVLIFLKGCGYGHTSQHEALEYTPVVAYVSNCDVALVQKAVKNDPTIIEDKEWEGATLLHNAVKNNCEEVTEYLLNSGANVNAKMDDGVTPLHIAARNGNIQIIEILVLHGADINAIDSKGWTPLDRAVKWNKQEAIIYIKNHGGVPNE